MNTPALVESDLPTMLRRVVREHPEHPAIHFAGRTTDFATFDAVSDRVATALRDQGVVKGDRIALYCANSDAFAVAYFGIVKAGATVVPLNLLLNPKEIEYILNDAGVKGIFYFEAFADCVSAFRDGVPGLAFAVAIGNKKSRENDINWSDWLTCHSDPPTLQFDPRQDVVALIYTSGTTGKPKGVMLTHYNLANNTTSVREALQVTNGHDVFLVVLPMFHAFAATVGMLMPLLHGLSFIPVPKFEPHLVANAIAEGKATVFLGVPSMFNVLLNLPDAEVAKFQSLRFCVSGGAAMPVELMRRFETRFGKPIHEGDGPTECSPVTCVNPIDGPRKPASVGVPVPRVEMRIMDTEGRAVPDNDVGEICVRGPSVMKGYWNRPEDTDATFFGEWLRTGDLGYRDDDGYFYIVDRIKDLVIVNGMNVYPRVVEEVLYQYEPVQEAAVVGEPHELHGEIPVAYVALKQGYEADAADIRGFCRERLGRHEVPRKVFFLDTLPKNAAGKILKRELRKHGEIERGVDSREE